MKLYYAAHSRAKRPRWMLEELAVPCEIVRVDRPTADGTRSGVFLRSHHAPVLVDDEVTVAHPSAICAYLADKYRDREMAPPPGDRRRGAYLNWLSYAASRLEPPLVSALLASACRDQTCLAAAMARFSQCAGEVPISMCGDYLMGASFSAADLVVGSILDWARSLGFLAGDAALLAYVDRVTDRESYRRARVD